MEFAEDMRPGQIVTIYRDPLEETRREGDAKLIARMEAAPGLQYWRVRFQPAFEEPIRKRFIAVLEPGQKVGNGIARMARL